MKKGNLILLLALVAGLTAFCAMRWHKANHHHAAIVLDAMPELEWLRSELHLTNKQFSRVRELHVAYRPRCAEMCRRIAEAHDEIEGLAKSTGEITPEFRSALKKHADIRVECQEAMLKHLYETAGTLREDQAARYLEAMLPFALDFSHSESGNPHAR